MKLVVEISGDDVMVMHGDDDDDDVDVDFVDNG